MGQRTNVREALSVCVGRHVSPDVYNRKVVERTISVNTVAEAR